MQQTGGGGRHREQQQIGLGAENEVTDKAEKGIGVILRERVDLPFGMPTKKKRLAPTGLEHLPKR